jgi:sporulation protein YunB
VKQRFHPVRKAGQKKVGSGALYFLRLRTLLVLLPLMFIVLVYVFDLRLRPQVATAASAVAKHAAAEAIQDALAHELVDDDKTLNLIEVKSHVGTQDMTIAKFNVQEMAKLQSATATRVDDELERLGTQKIPLPISQVIGGSIFSFADFSIPMKLSMIGTANSSVYADVQSAGVNQTVHILYLNIAVDVNVMTPFVTKPVHLETKSPVAYLVLSGPVPDVYYSGDKLPFKQK